MIRLSFIAIFLLGITRIALADAPTPPPQPTSGPGGSDYPFADMVMHRYGDGDAEYWIFEPAQPTPKSAPVIIFNHGWSAMTPNTYGAWIKHLARRGNIVIYPRYQASLRTPMMAFTPNAIGAVKDALAELQNGTHVQPELNHVAIVGHSMGGAITPNMVATAVENGLPIPKAICCVEADNHVTGNPSIHMPVADFSKISADTLMLVIVGDQDQTAGDLTGKMIFDTLTQIPETKKNFVTLVSDDHGIPPLVANHLAPIALEIVDPGAEQAAATTRLQLMRRMEENSVDAMDFYGTWKLFDGLTDAAFYGKNIQYALGNTPEQRFMDKWSDGTPVKELKVGD